MPTTSPDLTREILDQSPGLMGFGDFLRVAGIARTMGYSLLAKDALPVQPVRLGRRVFVRTADVRRWLGIDPAPAAAPASEPIDQAAGAA
ncbi:MAG: hypothetical protein QM589_12410 [Thermomicrobiales bacterium]